MVKEVSCVQIGAVQRPCKRLCKRPQPGGELDFEQLTDHALEEDMNCMQCIQAGLEEHAAVAAFSYFASSAL